MNIFKEIRNYFSKPILEDPLDNLPLRVKNHTNKGIKEEYRLKGSLYREDGPAVIKYDKEGKVIREEFWLYEKIGKEMHSFLVKYNMTNILKFTTDQKLLKKLFGKNDARL